VTAWECLPLVSPWLSGILSKLGFAGVVLTVSVFGAYLPQLMRLWSLVVIPFLLAIFSLVTLWATVNWYICLPLPACYAAVWYYLGHEAFQNLSDDHFDSAHNLAVYCGMLSLERVDEQEAARRKMQRKLTFTATRLTFDNVVDDGRVWMPW